MPWRFNLAPCKRSHWIYRPVALRGTLSATRGADDDDQRIAAGASQPHSDIPLVANALQHMSRTPAVSPDAPPMLGEHTAYVLTEWLALDAGTLADLKRDGVVFDGSGQRKHPPG